MPCQLGTLCTGVLAQYGTARHGLINWCKQRKQAVNGLILIVSKTFVNASHRRAMAATWSDKETLKLVELWGNEEIQVLLEGCTRNKHVYNRIAQGWWKQDVLKTECCAETKSRC